VTLPPRPAPTSPVQLIERLAPRAWPAETSVDLDGWSLRRTPGEPTRRANSALPNAHDGAMDVETKIDAVEVFYAGTEVPPRFQITPLAAPRGLDQILDRRGYLIDAPTLVMTADVAEAVKRRPHTDPFTIVLCDSVDDDWLATLYGGQASVAADVTRIKILERIEPATIYARVSLSGRSAAVGLGVLEAGWVGIYCVATASDMRRRGAATAVMAALLRSAAEHGAEAAYLGVLEENVAARALYERLRFRALYRYHYRWLRPGRD
jgi:ribosomal protein S18 acetylase RimI-like enzyme